MDWWSGYEGLYPADHPKCMFCEKPAMDGHFTCGMLPCDERAARDRYNEIWQLTHPNG
jgi:hypothetical protein